MVEDKMQLWDVLLLKKEVFINGFDNVKTNDLDLIGVYDNLEDALFMYEHASDDCQKRITISHSIFNSKSGEYDPKEILIPYFDAHSDELKEGKITIDVCI